MVIQCLAAKELGNGKDLGIRRRHPSDNAWAVGFSTSRASSSPPPTAEGLAGRGGRGGTARNHTSCFSSAETRLPFGLFFTSRCHYRICCWWRRQEVFCQTQCKGKKEGKGGFFAFGCQFLLRIGGPAKPSCKPWGGGEPLTQVPGAHRHQPRAPGLVPHHLRCFAKRSPGRHNKTRARGGVSYPNANTAVFSDATCSPRPSSEL